jgi:hypothetical protein
MYPKESLGCINIHSQTLTPEFSFEKGLIEAGRMPMGRFWFHFGTPPCPALASFSKLEHTLFLFTILFIHFQLTLHSPHASLASGSPLISFTC